MPGVRDSGGSSLLGPLGEGLVAHLLPGAPGVERQLALGVWVDKGRCAGNAPGGGGGSSGKRELMALRGQEAERLGIPGAAFTNVESSRKSFKNIQPHAS